MANDREVSLRINAQTAGGDKIRELAAEVDKLAAEGGAAAPEFKKLADELKKLEQQQGVITQFTELSRKATETKVAFEQAAGATRTSVAAIEDRKTALAAAAAAEKVSSAAIKEHRTALESTRTSLVQVKAEIAQYKAEIATSGKATDEQTKALAAAKTQAAQFGAAIATAKAAIASATPAQRENAAALNAANNSLRQATTEFNRNKSATEAARVEYERTASTVQKVGEQMDRLGVSSRNLGAAQQQVTAGFKQASQEVDQLRDKAARAGGGFGILTNFVRGAAGQITALVGAVAGLTEFVRVNVELENVNRTLLVLTGSSKAAAAEMDFIKDVSNRLGLELIETSKSYAQFAASTKGTTLEGEQTRRVFESVSNAMSVAGKSAADTTSALNALGQMVSKGVVSMEELRGQLGDRLPGALKAAADGLGITSAQLIKMVSDGRVLAVDLLPKLADALDKTYKAGANAGSTLQQDWNRFKNAISGTAEELGQSGIIRSFLELGRVVSTVAAGFGNFVSIVGTVVGSTFGVLFEQVSILKDAIVNFSFDGFMQKSRNAAQVLRDTMGAEMDRAANSIRKFSEQSTVIQWALNLVGLGADKAAVAVAKTSDAAAKAAAAADQAGMSWVKLGVIYKELKDSSDSAVQASEKGVAARKAEGDAAIALANAFGTELDQRKAVAEAAAILEAGREDAARKRVADLSLLQSELAALQEWVRTNKDASKERQAEIEELQKKIAGRKEETDKAIAQAQAAKVLTEQARVEVAAHADNSARLGELRDAYSAATKEVDRLRLAKVAGNEVTKDLTDAELKAAKAATMYRDALKDQTEYLKASGDTKQAQLSLQEVTLKLELEEINRLSEVARAKGDEGRVRSLAIEQRRIEIELMRLQAQMMRAEAEIQLELVKVQREDLKARGELTRAKDLELQKEELLAKAKTKQADLTDVSIRKLEDLKQIYDGTTGRIGTYNSATDQAGNTTRRMADDVDRLGDKLGRTSDGYERLANGVKKVNGSYVNQDGLVSDKNGNAISMTTRPGPWADQNGNWFYTDKSGQVRRSGMRQPVQDQNGNWMDPQEMPVASTAPTTARRFSDPQSDAPQPSSTTAPTPRNSMHTVVLSLNGRETAFNMASEQDSQILVGTLEQLQNDMRRYSA